MPTRQFSISKYVDLHPSYLLKYICIFRNLNIFSRKECSTCCNGSNKGQNKMKKLGIIEFL